jgi:hypothetical protein
MGTRWHVRWLHSAHALFRILSGTFLPSNPSKAPKVWLNSPGGLSIRKEVAISAGSGAFFPSLAIDWATVIILNFEKEKMKENDTKSTWRFLIF